MSAIDALKKFIENIKSKSQPITFYESDDSILFIVNLIENIFDFETNFLILKKRHIKNKDFKNDFIMEFVLNFSDLN